MLDKKIIFYILIVLGLLCSILLKYLLFPFESLDYIYHLSKWMKEFSRNDWKSLFSSSSSNYTPAYLYFLIFISKFVNINFWIYGIKWVSIVFELLGAFFFFRIIDSLTLSKVKAAIGGLAFFCLPTIILNGGMWGQCDVIYTSFCLGGLFYLSKKRTFTAMVFFGMAFSFKLQTIFILPAVFWVLFFKKGYRSFLYLGIIPLVYSLSIIPASFLGGSYSSLFFHYFNNNGYEVMELNAPNVYAFISNNYLLLNKVAQVFTLLVTILVYTLCFYRDYSIDTRYLIKLSLLFSLLLPYFLPRMHERYFFMSEVLVLLYCFCIGGKVWFVWLSLQFIGLVCYLSYLFSVNVIELKYLAILMAICITIIGHDVFKQRKEPILEADA